MQLTSLFLVVLAASAASASADHPIAKVITLLQDLQAQVKSEGQAEEVSFGKFTYWCQTSTAELEAAIKEEKDTIDSLESTIEGKTKEVALFKDDISKLEDEIKDLEAADKTATDEDKARTALYTTKETDFKSTISSIDECIKALEGAKTATDSKLLLIAQSRVRDVFGMFATVTTDSEQKSLMNFMEAKSYAAFVQSEAPGDAEKHVKKYSFKSDSVTELLKNLKLKFEDDLLAATKAETNAANAFALAKNARDATTKAAKTSKAQKEKDLGDAEGALSKAQGDLKDQNDDLKADTGALDSTTDSCRTKKMEWGERSNIRKGELEAMSAAVEILAKVSGVRTEAPSNPVPPPAPVKSSLLAIPAKDSSLVQTDPQKRVVQLLRATAKTYHSRALDRLAQEISTHVPKQFQDVINAIQKMIFRLKQEQTDEDNHKAWCDLEMAKTTASLSDKNDKIAELDAKLKEDNAQVVTLTVEIQAAEKMVADVNKFQKEATEIRQTGKQENTLAIKDAVAAQKAITNAISVLTDFYKSSGQVAKESWELLQEPVKLPKDPATWTDSYTGVNDPKKSGTGVIAVLEAVSSDFSKMEANTKAQEIADQKEYEDTMKEHSIELARRSKEAEMKSAQKKRTIDKITSLTANKKHVSDEVESTEQYEKDLKPACVDGDSTYKDRKAARDAEIKALGDAQGILDTAFAAKSFLQKIAPHA